jgi:DNA-binding transcriptional regulator YdaS (Cro superfamily)
METKASRALNALLDKQGRGGAKSLAHRLGVTDSAISRWRRGEGTPNADYRPALENATMGQVKADDWAKAVRL